MSIENPYTDEVKQEAITLSRNLIKSLDTVHQLLNLIESITNNKKWKKTKSGNYTKKVSKEENEIDGKSFFSKTSKISNTRIHKLQLRQSKKKLNLLIDEISKFSSSNNYYWRYCSLETYQIFCPNFKENFLDSIPEAEPIDFLEYEFNYYQKHSNHRTFYHNTEQPPITTLDFTPFLTEKNKLQLQISDRNKVKFITDEIERHGYIIESGKEPYKITQNPKKTNTILIENKVLEKHLDIFKDATAYELFKFLEENHQTPHIKTKYIQIFIYLDKSHNCFVCTQKKYLEFVKEFRSIAISKFTPTNHNYTDKILPKFKNLASTFYKNQSIS